MNDPKAPRTNMPPAPFLIGMPDSGVEVLRLMLDAHPNIAIPSPTFFVPAALDAKTPEEFLGILTASQTWRDHHLDSNALGEALRRMPEFEPAGAVRLFYRMYAARFGKARWGDSTHRYGHHMALLHERLPETRFLHVIRDGRDAALVARRSHGWKAFGSVETHAREWAARTVTFARNAREVPYLEIRFEDLVTRTQEVLWRVCRFLELDYTPLLLQYHARAAARIGELEALDRKEAPVSKEERLRGLYEELLAEAPGAAQTGRWRTEMSAADIDAYQRGAGELLRRLGYPVPAAARAS
ncbi:MAG: sulfotransferase [Bryobacterales bacterium]|nr:sulfotransferase [Bryobacterales bacterium]